MMTNDAQNSPKISVVIPLYNHARYIEETVDSVLKQSYRDFELIIVNDGSSDDSEAVVGKIKDERIRYFSQENQGAARTLNRGVRLARGEYVSILNSDDVYYPERLEECASALDDDPSLSAVFSHLEFIDAGGNFVKYLRGAEENWEGHTPETSFKGAHNMVLDLLGGNFLTTTSNLCCRRGVFDTVGFFSDLRYAHDYDFFLRLCSGHKVRLIEKPLVKYRIHNLNTVKESEAAVNFEVGLVLADFFLHCDFRRLCESGGDLSSVMTKFHNSVNTYHAERMIMVLILFGMRYPDSRGGFLGGRREVVEGSFRDSSVALIQKRIDDWREAQELWPKLVAANEETKKWWLYSQEGWRKVARIDKELAQAYEETKKWWLASQDAWKKVEESNLRLAETEQRLAGTEQRLAETKGELGETAAHLWAVKNSRSFRLGRALTWPLRKVLGKP
jgi:glycosyltransferase involved in cell wall biosynthesis